MKDREKKRYDILLITGILLIACILFAVNYFLFRKPAAMAEISVDGKVVYTLPLDKDIELTVSGYRGGSNHLVIEGGEIWADGATCPDKVCVHQGRIHRNGEAIVCLPNRMIAKIIGGE